MDLKELIDKIGYEEFVIQLIQHEKPRFTRRLAEKIYEEFMIDKKNNYYTSILELENLCDEHSDGEDCDVYLREEHSGINDLSTILQEEYLGIKYDEIVKVTTDYYIGVIDDEVACHIHVRRG